MSSRLIDSLERAQMRRVPSFAAGDRVRVHFQVVEGERRRTQVFEGIVIKRQGSGARESFTVRKQSFGVGVERTFPVHSPKIEQIEVVAHGDVRRAKLYYLRERVGRGARVRERRYQAGAEEREAEAGVMPEDEEALRPGEEELAESEAARAEAETEPEAEAEHEGGEPEPVMAGDEETDAEASEESAGGDAPATEEEPAEQAAERPPEGES